MPYASPDVYTKSGQGQTLILRDMKIVYGLVLSGVLLVLIVAILLASRAGRKDFCLGPRKCELSRIVFDGQQRQAILSDPTSLSYLCSLQRFMPLPANLQITNGLSFEAKLYDKWGELGSIALSFGYDKKVIELIYVSSTDERNSYLVLDKHLPPKLDEMMTFLLAKENIGKCWTEAGVRSTN